MEGNNSQHKNKNKEGIFFIEKRYQGRNISRGKDSQILAKKKLQAGWDFDREEGMQCRIFGKEGPQGGGATS